MSSEASLPVSIPQVGGAESGDPAGGGDSGVPLGASWVVLDELSTNMERAGATAAIAAAEALAAAASRAPVDTEFYSGL